MTDKKDFASVYFYEMDGRLAKKPHRYPCGLILGDVSIPMDWDHEHAKEKVVMINKSLARWILGSGGGPGGRSAP